MLECGACPCAALAPAEVRPDLRSVTRHRNDPESLASLAGRAAAGGRATLGVRAARRPSLAGRVLPAGRLTLVARVAPESRASLADPRAVVGQGRLAGPVAPGGRAKPVGRVVVGGRATRAGRAAVGGRASSARRAAPRDRVRPAAQVARGAWIRCVPRISGSDRFGRPSLAPRARRFDPPARGARLVPTRDHCVTATRRPVVPRDRRGAVEPPALAIGCASPDRPAVRAPRAPSS